jgi:hypothetical protein
MKRFPALMVGMMLGAALVGSLWRWHVIHLNGGEVDWPAAAGVASDLAQVIAFIAAGTWTYRLFVKNRMDRQRAELTQWGNSVRLGNNSILLHIVLEVKNVGAVELCPHRVRVEIRSVLNSATPFVLPRDAHNVEYQAHLLGNHLPEIANCSVDTVADGLTLEPGESERYPFDFVLPATHSVVQVHSKVRGDEMSDGLYWDETTIIDLRAADGIAKQPVTLASQNLSD